MNEEREIRLRRERLTVRAEIEAVVKAGSQDMLREWLRKHSLGIPIEWGNAWTVSWEKEQARLAWIKVHQATTDEERDRARKEAEEADDVARRVENITMDEIRRVIAPPCEEILSARASTCCQGVAPTHDASPFTPNVPSRTAPLSHEETMEEKARLVSQAPSMVGINRRYVDPPFQDQKYALISFVPSEGASADPQGFFGFAKIRGVFLTETEADERAEDIIREVDSVNPVLCTYVGRPFPVCASADLKDGKLREVDMQRKAEEAISANVLKKRREARAEMEEIRQRELELKSDVVEEHPEDDYVTLRVKWATLKFTAEQHREKIKECDELREKCAEKIKKIRAEHPEYEEAYMERYQRGRSRAGFLNAEGQESDAAPGFLTYMKEDIE